MDRYAVIAVGYNRYFGLKRLLKSIVNSNYKNEHVDLIVSLDKSEIQDSLIKLAESVPWSQGEKKIIAYDTRQGLRPHIIACGNLSFQYKAVIILEDDLIVSPEFFNYAISAVEYYKNDSRIAGISLYRHYIQVDCYRPFIPEEDGSFIYMMQFAQSWGECWTANMWNDFIQWYNMNKEKNISGDNIPSCIKKWNEHSWMKYYMKYIVETNRFFVYPKVSLTTCYADSGQHGKKGSNDYQVPLLENSTEFRFVPFDDAVKYDVFFERIDLHPVFSGDKKICIDLYGTKTSFNGYDLLASTARRPYKIIHTFMLRYRPQEKNLLDPIEGSDIYIYDLHVKNKKPKSNTVGLVRYDIKAVKWKRFFVYGMYEFVQAVKRKIWR